jgi:hypothetical protein
VGNGVGGGDDGGRAAPGVTNVEDRLVIVP